MLEILFEYEFLWKKQNPEQRSRKYWNNCMAEKERKKKWEKTQTNIKDFEVECELNWIYAWN